MLRTIIPLGGGRRRKIGYPCVALSALALLFCVYLGLRYGPKPAFACLVHRIISRRYTAVAEAMAPLIPGRLALAKNRGSCQQLPSRQARSQRNRMVVSSTNK